MSHEIIQARESGVARLEDRDRKFSKESWGWFCGGFVLALILLANCTRITNNLSRFVFLGLCTLDGTAFLLGKQAAGKRHDLQFDLEQETSHFYDLKAIYRGTEAAVVEIHAHAAAQLAAGVGYADANGELPTWYDTTCAKLNEIFAFLNVKARVEGVEHTEFGVRYIIDRYSPELDYEKLINILKGSKFLKEVLFHAKLPKVKVGRHLGTIYIESIDPDLLPAGQQTISVTGQPVGNASLPGASQPMDGTIVSAQQGSAQGFSPAQDATVPPLTVLLGPGRDDQHHRYWIPSQQSNGFVVCSGGSGAGKTEFLKVTATEIRNYGIPMTLVDFHGDVEVPGYKVITLAVAAHLPYGINPLELDSKNPLDGGVYSQIDIVFDMLKNTVDSIGHQQEFMIKAALKAVYADAGITDADPSTYELPPPTFHDVLAKLRQAAQSEDIDATQRNTILRAIPVVDKVFSHPVFCKTKQLSPETLATGWYRLNMKHLTEPVKYVVAETVLRKVSRYLRSKGHIPVQPANDRERYRWFFGVDEAKILSMGGKNKDDSNAPLQKAATEDRKFGLGLVLCSQILNHFSDELLAQMGVRVVLKPLDAKQAVINAATIGVAPEVLLVLEGKGDGFLWLSNGKPPTRIGIIPTFLRPGFQPYVAEPEETIDQFDDWDKRAEEKLKIEDVDAVVDRMEEKEDQQEQVQPQSKPSSAAAPNDPTLTALLWKLQAWIDKKGTFPTDEELRLAIEAILNLPDNERLSDRALQGIKSHLRPPQEG